MPVSWVHVSPPRETSFLTMFLISKMQYSRRLSHIKQHFGLRRIGQTKDVRIYRLITRNTYEQQLFECSSRKYGLDEAILGNRVGADVDVEMNRNIESLLKHGAYDILKVVYIPL